MERRRKYDEQATRNVITLMDIPSPILRQVVGLWRRRWLALAVAWAVAMACWIGVWMLPDRFESTAQIYVNTDSILDPIMKNLAPRPDPTQRIGIMRQRLLTRPNLEQVVYEAGLDVYAKTPAALERMTLSLAEDIKVTSPQDGYFVMSYRSWDPKLAQKVVAAVVNLFIENDLGASLTDLDFARSYLDKQVGEYEERLSDKERERAQFEREHAGELAGGERNLRRLEQKEQETARLEEDLAAAKRRVNALQNAMAQTPTAGSTGELEILRKQLAELRATYTDSYPDVQATQARIRELERGSAGAPTNPEYQRLQTELRLAQEQARGIEERQERVRAEIEELNLTVQQVPEVQAELQKIVRDYEQTQETYNELAFRRNQLSLTASLGDGGDALEYKIYEEPRVPIEPVDPPRGLLSLAGLIIALGVGAGVAALLTLLDRTFLHQGDLKSRLGLPVLGALSVSLAPSQRKSPIYELGALAAACFGLVVVAGGLFYAYEMTDGGGGSAESAVATPSQELLG